VKDEVFKLRLSGEQRASYEAEANRAGLSLSEWLRRSADETVALARSLELQAEDVRRQRDARAREAEQSPVATARRRRRPAPNHYERRMGRAASRSATFFPTAILTVVAAPAGRYSFASSSSALVRARSSSTSSLRAMSGESVPGSARTRSQAAARVSSQRRCSGSIGWHSRWRQPAT